MQRIGMGNRPNHRGISYVSHGPVSPHTDPSNVPMDDSHFQNIFSEKFPPGAFYSASSPWNLTQLINFRIITCFSVFVLLYISFLLILPGIREKRFISFITITLQLLIGSLLIGSLILPYWKVGEVSIDVQFQSHTKQRSQAQLGVWVGLRSLNITLKYLRATNRSLDGSQNSERMLWGMYLNERFDLGDVGTMSSEFQSAYAEGFPYPMLTILEYFSLSQGAFVWGHQFRNAGHYTNAMLWTAFAAWLLQGVFLALLPHHYSKAGILCGVFALISNVLYIGCAPADLNAPFPAPNGAITFLHLHYGICFYMSIIAGILSIFFGLTLSLLQFLRLYTLRTILDSYLDDTVGVKCQYGRTPIIADKARAFVGIEANMSSAASSSSNTASSSIFTTSRSGNLSFEEVEAGNSSAKTSNSTASLSSTGISPTTSSASVVSLKNQERSSRTSGRKAPSKMYTGVESNHNQAGLMAENSKSLDLLRKRALERNYTTKGSPKLNDPSLLSTSRDGDHLPSSMSVCSIDSEAEASVRMTDDEEDKHQKRDDSRERKEPSPTCRISPPSQSITITPPADLNTTTEKT